MKRYIDVEAIEKTVNDPQLPKRTKGKEAKRAIAFLRLYIKHFNAILKDAKEKKDIIVVVK